MRPETRPRPTCKRAPRLSFFLAFVLATEALLGGCGRMWGDDPTYLRADVSATADFGSGVLAREKATGLLWFYPGNGSNGLQARRTVGQGWSGMDVIVGADDFDRDGHPDVLARAKAGGEVYLYPGNAAGTGFLARKTVGQGWGGMRAILGAGDFDNDGRADVVAWSNDGTTRLYPGNGVNGFGAARVIAIDLGGMNLLLAAGDLDDDGKPDLLARDDGGSLWLYPGDGAGGVQSRRMVGSGWTVMDVVLGAGDFNGDGLNDLLARESATAKLWLYPGQGNGLFGSKLQVGTGWNGMDALATASPNALRGGINKLAISRAGYVLKAASNDVNLHQSTLTHLVKCFFATLPREAATFNPSAPRAVSMSVDTAYDGVAATSGTNIVVSARYIDAHPEDYDVITHEAMHVVQGYSFGNVPGYWTEGLADYARARFGINNGGAGWALPGFSSGQSFTDSYRVTASFLMWLTARVDATLPVSLDARLRSGTYTDAFWTKMTGKTIAELWAMYAASPDLPSLPMEGTTTAPLYELVIDAPTNGATVSGVAQVKGWARGFLNVELWDDDHQSPPLGRATPAADGAFTIEVKLGELTPGAASWVVHAWDSLPGTSFTRSDEEALSLTIGAQGTGGATGTSGTGGAGRNYLLGFYTNGKTDGPYHTWLAYYPEVFYGNSYQAHEPGGVFYPPAEKYPIVLDVDICGAKLPYADVAAGRVDAELIATRDSLPASWYPYVYAIRIDSEFNLNCSWDVATYAKAAEHVISLYKAKLPARVKYIWNPAVYHGDDLDKLVPSNCDVIGIDAYAQPQWNATSQYLFSNQASPSVGSLWWWTKVAKQKGKAIALPEWADDYGDGLYVRDVAAWADDPSNNVVFLGYWDSPDVENGTLRGASLTAFTKAFANRPYTGSLFLPLISSTDYPPGF